MCVQLFTAFEEAVLKVICTLVSALKSKMATIWNRSAGKKIIFFSIFFILIIINVQ